METAITRESSLHALKTKIHLILSTISTSEEDTIDRCYREILSCLAVGYDGEFIHRFISEEIDKFVYNL